MVNHSGTKGYLSELEDYLSELKGKRKIKLGNRDKLFLVAFFAKPGYLSSLNKRFNELYKLTPLFDEDARKQFPKRFDAKHAPHFLLTGPTSKPATHKAIEKLLKYGLIKPIDKERLRDKKLFEGLKYPNLTSEAFFAANLKRAKLFDITEYGIFCFLSQTQILDFDPFMLGSRWESKTIKLLLSPYFEKETVARRLTTLQFWMIGDFLQEALHIVEQRLSIIENQTKSDMKILGVFEDPKKSKKVAYLEDDLQWHAKSFALRLIVDTTSKDKYKREESRRKLNFLFHDKKFLKLAEDTMHELLSYYRGGKLLEFDKTLHP